MALKYSIGMNGLALSLKKLFSKTKGPDKKPLVNKQYEGTSDNFFTSTNSNLQSKLKLESKCGGIDKVLKRKDKAVQGMDVPDGTPLESSAVFNDPLNKTPYKASYLKLLTPFEEDLEKYGTTQGIINVANDTKKRQAVTEPLSKALTEKLFQASQNRWKEKRVSSQSMNPFSEKYREFPKFQITVHNTSNQEQEVNLWGQQRYQAAVQAAPQDVQLHTVSHQIDLPGGIAPQGVVINPANQYTYVANQLSGNISILNSANQLVHLVQLEPAIPGLTSPVSLTVNTYPGSSTYGFVFVACSVSSQIAVIDLAHTVVAMVPTGVRPLFITFNPVNLTVYTSNLVSNTITAIHAESFQPMPGSPMVAGHHPYGICAHPVSGEVYVANWSDNSVSLYNPSNLLIQTISHVGLAPAFLCYSAANQFMYVCCTGNNSVYPIDGSTYNMAPAIAVSHSPIHCFFNPANNYVYVQCRGSNSLDIIDPGHNRIATLNLCEQNTGGVYNLFNQLIYLSDTLHNRLNTIGYQAITPAVVINPDYNELLEGFKSSPAIIKHSKFVVTGPERLHSFRLNRKTPTGKTNSRFLSLESYASPQQTINVAEVTGLAGTLIDGRMNWTFRLPALHSVSILIWFNHYDLEAILNETQTKKSLHKKPLNHKSNEKQQTKLSGHSLHSNSRGQARY